MRQNKYANSENYGERIARLESSSNHVFTILSDIKSDIKQLSDRMENGFKNSDARIDKINSRLWTLFYWMIGGFASVLYVIAHAHKWV